MSKQAVSKLYRIAEKQQGCFTAQQARLAGFSAQLQAYHVQVGNWERLARGIFRLKLFPQASLRWLMITYLWSSDKHGVPQAVFSHETALSLHDYSVWRPRNQQITVPLDFRRHSKPPYETKLYKGDVHASDVMWMEGVPLTKPVRTVVDLLKAGFIERHVLMEHMRVQIGISAVTHRDLTPASFSQNERELILWILEKIAYERIKEIRDWVRIQASA